MTPVDVRPAAQLSGHQAYLSPTRLIDSDHPEVIKYGKKILGDNSESDIDKAVKLYYAVRDDIFYNPQGPFFREDYYRASNVIARAEGYCVTKASLLCALGRASGIPSRVGFADIRNHLAPKEMTEMMGTNVFAYHGYTEFYLGNKWVRATPAFNQELYEKLNADPLEFNGQEDAAFPSHNREGRKFIEYLVYHGPMPDIPVDRIMAAWEKEYGRERVKEWIRRFEENEKT